MALELKDTSLLRKLSEGDMVALDAKYHKKCHAALFNRYRQSRKQSSGEEYETIKHSIALAQLVSFIKDAKIEGMTAPAFKLSDLTKDYCTRLQQLGVNQTQRIHTTRLKEKLLAHIPGLSAHKKGREVILAYDDDIGQALVDTYLSDTDSDAMCMAQVATIIRKDLFEQNEPFTGTFKANCQIDCVSTSLLSLVRMILEGPSIKNQTSTPLSQSALTISQLLQFNSVKHKRQGLTSVKHSRAQETPLPLYVGTMLHSVTRKKELVDKMHEIGLSVSYDRVLRVSASMANAVCELYEEEKVVCPPKMNRFVFTTAAIDNIDHNPSSASATGSFHGTGISLIQHPSFPDEGQSRESIVIKESAAKCIKQLPLFYTTVPPISVVSDTFQIPAGSAQMNIPADTVVEAFREEEIWLQSIDLPSQARQTGQELLLDGDDVVEGSADQVQTGTTSSSWSAFHAKRTTEAKPKCHSSLLPLFQDSAHSLPMIHHGMTVVKQAVQFLNPGQTPVLACDQPLFALAKEIQWKWPESFGEDQMVIMLGGLHIEMTCLKTIGTWLDGSGWVQALVTAEVTTAGRADALLQASHVTRTRYAHQVTAACLFQLKQLAYRQYVETRGDTDQTEFSVWCKEREMESPQFKYWSITLEFELLILIFVRSIRESNFALYIASLREIVPWFFALDRTNYSRWLSVHIKDMLELQEKHPALLQSFVDGKFTVTKTSHAFSAISLDQAHEQNNALVKGEGGAVGLTESPSALLRWMVAGPEIARVVQEFQDGVHIKQDNRDIDHHEMSGASQKRFTTHVESLVEAIDEMGNPFIEQSNDIICLSTKAIADQSVQATVNKVRSLGESQYTEFVKERLVTREKSIKDAIPQNRLPLIKQRTQRSVPKDKMKLQSAKNNCQLFSKLYIGCQNRDGNLKEFFCHENQGCPPALSDGGTLRLTTKSDLLPCLDKLVEPRSEEPVPTVVIIDGAALVQMLKPGLSRTFREYSEQVFVPYLSKWMEKVQRLDIVWDMYLSTSLKASTRAKRGKGSRQRVIPNAPIPANWQDFLRMDDNKTELFEYLAMQIVLVDAPGKNIVATKGQTVLTYPGRNDITNLSPCEHEEADTRMMVHVADAVESGHTSIVIRTVDTDVVVLAVSVVHKLQVPELWIAFGTGKKIRYLPAHDYARALGAANSKALPIFHAFTGCDTTSAFCGHGKKTAWATWTSYPDVTNAFLELADKPLEISEQCLASLERFVVLFYDRTSTLNTVNDARMFLFTKKGRSLEGLPPTSAALMQHIRRTAFQGGHVWGQSLVPVPTIPCPSDWGWIQTGNVFEPRWSTIPEASQCCYELVHCTCKKGCLSRCKCVKAALPCTPLCACDGQCCRD